jgi:Lrp/AsnC family leucine-responsive transcriptional regulator
MIGLDATDWNILHLLQGNGRISNAELAAQIHRSESACHRRVRRLEAEGVIESYVSPTRARRAWTTSRQQCANARRSGTATS